MEVKYLEEYADSDILYIPDDTNLNSNDINILAPQSINVMLENNNNNFKEILNKKENEYQSGKCVVHVLYTLKKLNVLKRS